MRPCNRLPKLCAVAFALSLSFVLVLRAPAQTVTLLNTEDFSSGVPPSGWTEPSGAWYQNYNGINGGYCADCDDWDYYWENDGPLSTPTVDASSYAKSSDSVWVDFDFFWEFNGYTSYGPDTWEVLAGTDVIQSGTEETMYSWDNESDYSWDNVQTDPSYWTHYHLLVPVADRTSSMQIGFEVVPNYGCSNPSIANVSITAYSKPPGEFSLLPKALNFGTATPNSPDTLCVTAYSVGVVPIHITGFGITGSSAFTEISGPAIGDSINPDNSAQYCFQFLPLGGGTLNATFTLQTDATDSATQSVSLTGVGAVPAVSYGVTELFRRVDVMLRDTSQPQYIPLTSTGQGPLHINSIYFIGLNPNDYFVSRMPQNPLPPDAVDSIGITFIPTIEGRPDAKVVIATDAANKPLDTVSLYGIGTLPHLVITVPPPGESNSGPQTSTVSFDSVAIGDSVCQTIQLTNPGTDTLQILKQLVTYGDYDFSFYPLSGADTAILPGGGTQLVNICFKPLKSGSRFASIRFYTNIPRSFDRPNQDTSQFLVNVTGVGVPYGHLEVVGSLVDTAIVGDTQCVTVTLKNNGQADVTVNSDSLSPDKNRFLVTVPSSFTLAPGQTQPLTFCYAPSARGTRSDTLVFLGTTAEQSFSQSFLLTGVGVVSCVSADSAITFGTSGMTMVGSTDTSCITVTNCGDIAATYTASVAAGSKFVLKPPLTSALIPAGGTANFCVVFTPDSLGAANGTVMISGGPQATTTLLSGVGAGVIAQASGSDTKPVMTGTCDTFAVQVTNNGNVSWMPGTGTISGPNASDFSIVSGPTPGTIAPGASATMMIAFCATENGTESMTLTFPNASPAPIAAFSYSTTAVGTSEGVAMRTSEDGFSIGASYPNPTAGSADMTVTLPYEAPVRIDIINATGAYVKTAFQGRFAGGSQIVTLDAKDIPSGTYFVQLSSGDVRLTRQMSVVK